MEFLSKYWMEILLSSLTIIFISILLFLLINNRKNKITLKKYRNACSKLFDNEYEINVNKNNSIINRQVEKSHQVGLIDKYGLNIFKNIEKKDYINNEFKDLGNKIAYNINKEIKLRKTYDFVMKSMNDANKYKAKLIMTLKEFRVTKNLELILNLISVVKTKDTSDSEIDSWTSNIGVLKSLFFSESVDNYLENSVLIFEQRLNNNKNDKYKYRLDLLMISKTEQETFNTISIELKRNSFINSENNFASEKKQNIKDQRNKHNSFISSKLKDNVANINNQHVELVYLYNMISEHVKTINIMDPNFYYSTESKNELAQRIYMKLTENTRLLPINSTELETVLKAIGADF